MTRQEALRKEITDKFRSVLSFCATTGTSYNSVMRLINGKYNSVGVKRIRDVCRSSKENNGGFILDKDRRSIRMCILTHHDNYAEFCKSHPEYDNVYLSNIIKGRLVEETPKYRKFVGFLVYTYGLDI